LPPGAKLVITDFGYTGQRALTGTGLMDYHVRFYDAALGRFLQPDTIISNPLSPQTWNRYSYVGNNPIMNNDPTGHKCTPEDDCLTPHGGTPLPGDPIPPDPKTNTKSTSGSKGCGGDGQTSCNGVQPLSPDGIIGLPDSYYYQGNYPNYYSQNSNQSLPNNRGASPWIIYFRYASTTLDIAAWGIDLYDAGVVIAGGILRAGIGLPFSLAGVEIPAVTGLGGMGIAELYVQAPMQISNYLSVASTGSTIVADFLSGDTNPEKGIIGTQTLNSLTTTILGYSDKEAITVLIIQSLAVFNDLSWTSFPFP
jgi:RHS repeat-associated protein